MLYDSFSAQVKKDPATTVTYGACGAITTAVSQLLGAGWSTEEVFDLVNRTVRESARIMSVVDPNRSMGENLDAMISAEKQPKLKIIEP